MSKKKAIAVVVLIAGLFAIRKGLAMVANKDLANQNVQAFLKLIKKYESMGGDYQVIYGGRRFDGFDSHPNIRVPFKDPRTGKMNYSTAAGAYQITIGTWRMINASMSLPDFSPASQDLAAVWLLNYCGAMPLIVKGDIEGALQKASTQWASLPFTTSMQNHVTLDKAIASYKQAGGAVIA